MTCVATHCKSKPRLYETERLSCPVCGSRVIDGRCGLKSKLYDTARYDWIPDYLIKCKKCGRVIGIEKE